MQKENKFSSIVQYLCGKLLYVKAVLIFSNYKIKSHSKIRNIVLQPRKKFIFNDIKT
jgi:hypothetical protein